MLASGKTVSQAAERMRLSVKTISTYRSRVLAKMNMRTNDDLAYYAARNGLVE
jgi:DNA-binding NarL/FixJ family response regulator